MKLPYYETLDIKNSHFTSELINNKEELDIFIEQYLGKQKNIFRGVNESKYKLYNSAQRVWIENELATLGKTYKAFIQAEIDNTKKYQNKLLFKYYSSFGFPTTDLTILSFLQHYGAPTPLLDWTYSLDCALFFATDGLKFNPSDDIDNYFSIYAIDLEWYDLQPFPELLEKNLKTYEVIIRDYPKVNIEEHLKGLEEFRLDSFYNFVLFYLPGYSSKGVRIQSSSNKDISILYNQHNLNVISQEGLFIFNSDSNRPLEDFFKNSSVDIEQKRFFLPKIYCWDIHKSLKDYVIRLLNTRSPFPINREYLFPQEEIIAQSAFRSFKNFT